jgi:hypothetical protein
VFTLSPEAPLPTFQFSNAKTKTPQVKSEALSFSDRNFPYNFNWYHYICVEICKLLGRNPILLVDRAARSLHFKLG